MAFFKKKTDPKQDMPNDASKDGVNNASDDAGEAAQPKPKKQKKAKKKKSPLAQVLHESVWETVQSDFKDNTNFMCEYEGKNWYVGIALDVKDIGGLDKRSKKNEAKGTLVECINSGRLHTYVTEDLMDAGLIMFIPEPVTLSVMDEFSMLTKAEYLVGLVNTDGDIVLTGSKSKISYQAAVAVATGECAKNRNDSTEIRDYIQLDDKVVDDSPVALDDEMDLTGSNANHIAGLPEEADKPKADTSGPKDEIEDKTAKNPAETDDDPDDIDDIPDIDDVEGLESVEPLSDPGLAGVPETPPVFDATAGTGPVQDPNLNLNPGTVPDPYQMAMQDAVPQEVENEIPASWTYESVVREFYSDQLGLAVSTGPFDVQFLANNPAFSFDTDRPPGWLNEQLNEMSRQANSRLAKLHEENLFTLRSRYFKLTALACDRIERELNIHDTNNQYGEILENLKRELDDARENISVEVTKRKIEMEQAWKMKLQEVGMDAARAAQHQYRARYGKQHEEEVYNIESIVKANIEADFNETVYELYQRRRDEASVQLDLNITEVLGELVDQYTSDLAVERDLYDQLLSEMEAFIEENRKADIVHTKTLAEDLRQTEKADQVLAEQTAKMRAICEEHKQRRQEYEDQISKIRSDNQATIDTLNREHDFKVKQLRDENAVLQDRLKEMMDKCANMDAIKGQEYESRMSELKEQVLSWEDKCAHIAEVHKKSNLTSVFFVVSAVIASLFIGFVGGEFINVNRQTRQEYNAIVEDSKAGQTSDKNKDSETRGISDDLDMDLDDDTDAKSKDMSGLDDLSDADNAKKTSVSKNGVKADVPVGSKSK